MTDTGKAIIVAGVIIVIIGLVISIGAKIPIIGKLPGDIYIKREGFTFYFPLATSIIISIVLTLILRFSNRH